MSDRSLIVCADDDEDILALVTLRLERAGYEVVAVPDGEAAVRTVRERRPALLVLDVMMPRLSGYEVLEQLRADPELAGVKIVLLSARVQESDVSRGLRAGADAYMPKPFRAQELVAQVQQLLESSS